MPSAALAQDADVTSPDSIFGGEPVEAADVITVTGSRLRRDSNLDSPSPIVSIDATALRGAQDVTDVLRTLPALTASVTSAQSVAPGELGSGGAIGAATLNLRGMGAERTLVLVNGRRHVAGVAETSVVDINSIPASLIKSVEVLTGGASAVYGADAVTGVVNFILDRTFDGLEIGATGGISDRLDGGNVNSYIKWGKNFKDGRGNLTLVGEYTKDYGLRFGDRAQFRDGNIASNGPNPDLRFQRGDLGAGTPNFSNFFSLDNGFFPWGFVIPTPGSARFNSIFPAGVTPTAAEQALIDRALNAPTRKIGSQYQFNITSAGGIVVPADFADPFSDINGDGRSDCTSSFLGFNSLFDYRGFGAVGGCWILTENGVKVVEDGLIASNFNSFGGDGVIFDNNGFLIPEIERFGFNILTDYDLGGGIKAVFEGKYYRQETTFGTKLNSFYDLLTVAPDNPFIPAPLRPISDAAGGLFITRDPTDLGPNIDTNVSETFRFVGGLEGDITDKIRFEVSANWGRYNLKEVNRNNVLLDRFFAAIDVTTDANGNPVCRSELDPTVRSPSTPFGIPAGEFGYLTFVPGQGQCRPANILGGPQSISPEAVDFITTTTINRFRTELFEIHSLVAGDTSDFFNLPYDSIQFAVGAEYRKETARSTFDPLVRGILPVTTVDGNAGDFVGDLGFTQTSLGTPPDGFFQNSGGSYDVIDVFGEIGTTLLRDLPLIDELRLELAGRMSHYNTVGTVFTYAVNGFWAPVRDLRFRGTLSRAVRAPNISELFAPPQAAFFRPFDPCDQTEIDRLVNAGDANVQNRIANCRADGIPEGFSDPLSARFAGTQSGNPNLREEVADTFTVGAVAQPRFIPGLSMTVDYYKIRIDDAINTPPAQDIVNNCYDSTAFPNDFCSSFTRVRDPNSAQFLGFNSLTVQTINFVRIETAGIDATMAYNTTIGKHRLGAGLTASWVDRLNFFFDPTDFSNVDPELRELGRPRWSGRGTVSYGYEGFNLGYTLNYFESMGLRGVEIERIDSQFGPAGLSGDTFVHNLNASYTFDRGLEVFGGINNLTNVRPFITERAFPVNPIGRSVFLGVRWTM
ncbi:MAG: TonB-dependent receptor domain-containing protein [Erythrobacter sp.]